MEDAYAAFTAGEFEKARDIARGAVAADPSSETLVARKVLIRSLGELGDVDGAMMELERMRVFDLLPSDAQWAADTEARILAARTPPPPAEPSSPAADTPRTPSARSAGLVTLGGGFRQVGQWSYGTVALDGAARIVGPIWVGGGGQLGISPSADCSAQPIDEGACTALFTTLHVGPMLRLDASVQPFVRASFLLGVNGPGGSYQPVLPGLEIAGGVELGPGAIAVRPRVAFRLLAPLATGGAPVPGVDVGVDVALRFGSPR